MSLESPAQPRDNREKNRFELATDAGTALAEYRLHGKNITFTHTEVPPSLRGTGVGSQLVAFALQESMKNHLHVVAECPFVAQYLRRHPDVAQALTQSASA